MFSYWMKSCKQSKKVTADIKFIRTCKKEYLVPTFANLKLAIRHENKKLKPKIFWVKKIRKKTRESNISFKGSLNIIHNCIIH